MPPKKAKIELSIRFSFPGKLSIVEYLDKYLVICGDNGKWIVLNNSSQVQFVRLLETASIGDALNMFSGTYDDAKEVVKQIVARKLDGIPTMRASVDGSSVMHLYLTNQCNMRCPHCYMLAGTKLQDELSTEEVKYILSNFKEYNGSLVTLSGGEVSTRKDLIDICKFAKSINLPIEILTNGFAWSDYMIDSIAPSLYRIQISIDGFNEDENKKIRGSGAFEKALSTVDRFVKAGVKTEVAITPVFSSELHRHVNDYLTFANSLEYKYKDYKFRIQFNGELMDGRDIRLTKEQRDYYANFVHELLSKKYGTDSKDGAFIGTMKQDVIKDNCNYGNLTIAANGDVYFCAFIPTLKPIGNIRTSSFDDLMKQSEEAKSLSVVDKLIPCKDCELKYICGGDCRINHFPHIHNPQADKMVQCARSCSKKVKDEFYDMMIRTNEALFS